jgi:hypothetical protein
VQYLLAGVLIYLVAGLMMLFSLVGQYGLGHPTLAFLRASVATAVILSTVPLHRGVHITDSWRWNASKPCLMAGTVWPENAGPGLCGCRHGRTYRNAGPYRRTLLRIRILRASRARRATLDRRSFILGLSSFPAYSIRTGFAAMILMRRSI